jgi:ABC-type amino acid transport substrate-binding protein
VLRREPASLSESNTELYEALASGKIDAVIDDSPIAMAFVAAVPNLSYQGAYEGTDAAYAIMLAKGNDVLEWELNTAISMLEAEGILASLRLHWFGTKELCIA